MARRLALITGASSGLGVAFAQKAAREGHDLALVARRRDRLDALADALIGAHGIDAHVIAADLSAPDAAAFVLEEISKRGRKIDILINNAGYSLPQTFISTSWTEQEDFIQVLATTPAALIHRILPGMMERRFGRIINVASLAALSSGAAGHTLYPAAKSFILKLSQSIAAETKGFNVNVTAVCPGFVRTEFHQANATAEKMAQAPRLFWQSAEDVVEESWRRNTRGDEIVIPGLHNKIAAALFKILPEAWTRTIVRRKAEKYRVNVDR